MVSAGSYSAPMLPTARIVRPPTATWGGMIREGFENILDSASLSVFPSLAILLVVFSLNMLGDGLRDAIDPKLRGGE